MRALSLGVAMTFAASGAFAGDDVMASYFGNTVVSKSGAGEVHTHYKKGGTLDATMSGMMGSITLTGTWKIDDKSELCRTYDNPPPMLPIPNPFCTPWEAHKVGDTWTVTVNGQTRTITLMAGVE